MSENRAGYRSKCGRKQDVAAVEFGDMNLPVAFDHCVVHVSNWERSNRFYREVLGAEVIDRGERFAYRFGETQLNLHGPGLKAEPLARVPVPPGGAISALPGKVQSKTQYDTCAPMVYRLNSGP